MNKTVEQVLQTMAADVDSKQVSKLSFVESAINFSVNASTIQSPFELVYGQQVRNVIDQLDELHRIKCAQQFVSDVTKLLAEARSKLVDAQLQQAKYYDCRHRPLEFVVGDKVLLAIKFLQLSGTRKFQQRYVGPLEVIKRIGTQVYRLALPVALCSHHNVFHVSLLRPYVAGGAGFGGPQPIIIDGEPEWEVEAILCHRYRRGIQQYLVKYVGYDQSEAMWLDESDLVNAPDILQAYK